MTEIIILVFYRVECFILDFPAGSTGAHQAVNIEAKIANFRHYLFAQYCQLENTVIGPIATRINKVFGIVPLDEDNYTDLVVLC